jgi:hypothetical protein
VLGAIRQTSWADRRICICRDSDLSIACAPHAAPAVLCDNSPPRANQHFAPHSTPNLSPCRCLHSTTSPLLIGPRTNSPLPAPVHPRRSETRGLNPVGGLGRGSQQASNKVTSSTLPRPALTAPPPRFTSTPPATSAARKQRRSYDRRKPPASAQYTEELVILAITASIMDMPVQVPVDDPNADTEW